METIDSVNWLKKNEIYDISERASQTVRKIFTPCLHVQDEKILILGDKGTKNRKVAAILAGAYYLAARSLNLNAKLVLQAPKPRGKEAEDDIINSLEGLQDNSIVCVCMSDKLGSMKQLGKSFRKYCEKKNIKFVTTTSLGDLDNKKIDAVLETLDISYKPLQDKQRIVKEMLDKAKELHITTEAGTDIHINVNNNLALSSDGNFEHFGKGGNLPAGEVFIAPNGRNVNGKIVIDGSSRVIDGTLLIKSPITLTIEDGSIVKIEGNSEAAALEKTLKWAEARSKNPHSVRRISEFGIGCNPKASIIGASVVDEKALNTAHIGIGSNYWFGGDIYGIIHLDQVFRNPKIYVDGKLLQV